MEEISAINFAKPSRDTGNQIDSKEFGCGNVKGYERRFGISKNIFTNNQRDYFSQLYHENKKNNLVSLFIRKMKQVSVGTNPIQHSSIEKFSISRRGDKPLKLPLFLDITLNILIIIQTLGYSFFTTLGLAFTEVNTENSVDNFIYFGLVIQILEMLSKLIFKSTLSLDNQNQEIRDVLDNIKSYFKKEFVWDLPFLIILILQSGNLFDKVPYIRLLFLLKLGQCSEKTKILEIFFIKNCYKQQYWQLIKVMLKNYAFAHLVTLILIFIAKMEDGDNNWLKQNNFYGKHWFEQYVWGYYFSINIILTVGFGDIHAVTTLQAGCLVFIETFSCILFTYNINTIGTIMKKIRSYDEEKQQNTKVFKRMQEKTEISDELRKRISTFINQSVDMKRKYNIQEEQKLIKTLPKSMVEEYRKETNMDMFLSIPFFRYISTRNLFQLACKVQRRLTHPQEIILSSKKIPNIVIANGGSISLHANSLGYRIHGRKMQEISIPKNKYKLLSFNFLFNEEMTYDIKCLDYSFIYQLTKEDLQEVINTNPYNYQYYCMMKDKDKFNIYDFDTLACDLCPKQKHTIFQCPKLHYIPIKQHIITKFNEKCEKKDIEVSKKIRQQYDKKKINALQQYSMIKLIQGKNQDNQSLNENKKTNKKKYSTDKNIRSFTEKNKTSFIKKKLIPNENEGAIKKIANQIENSISAVINLYKNYKFFEWQIECDKAHNFKYYFFQCNPQQLNKKKGGKKYYWMKNLPTEILKSIFSKNIEK